MNLLYAQSHPPVAQSACRLRLFAYRITLRFIRPQIRCLEFLPRSWSSNFVPSALPLSSIRYPAFSRTEIRLKRLAECEYSECCIKNFEQNLFSVLFLIAEKVPKRLVGWCFAEEISNFNLSGITRYAQTHAALSLFQQEILLCYS